MRRRVLLLGALLMASAVAVTTAAVGPLMLASDPTPRAFPMLSTDRSTTFYESVFSTDDPSLASVAPPMNRVSGEPGDSRGLQSPEFGVAVDVAFLGAPPDLSVVRWTTTEKLALADVAGQWGLRTKQLRELNPGLRANKKVQAGTELVVFEREEGKPPRSIGAPNNGRLRHGVPLPEGDVWRLRERRSRLYGSQHTVEALVMAMNAFGKAFPEAEPIRLGDLSARSGGRLSPHASHRSGRDIDIGYILNEGTRGDRYWQSADDESFDVERNWFLIKALIETGRVQRIFLSGRLNRLLMERAESELSEPEMQRYFRPANPDPTTISIVRHWRGHRDHMHVRFTCEPENQACVSRSVDDGV